MIKPTAASRAIRKSSAMAQFVFRYIQDCSILINTSSALGFRDQDLAAVVLIVRDFNKAPIHFGNNAANMILPGMFSLSSTAVQVRCIFSHSE